MICGVDGSSVWQRASEDEAGPIGVPLERMRHLAWQVGTVVQVLVRLATMPAVGPAPVVDGLRAERRHRSSHQSGMAIAAVPSR